MSKCIKTETYKDGSLIFFRRSSIIETTISGFFSRYDWQVLECKILASIAVAKSKQNM
jgi:hypothetical protein